MHLEYKVSLPSHDFPTGKQHKLIPYVYAVCKRQKNDPAISYNGPTLILQYGVANITKAVLRLIMNISKTFEVLIVRFFIFF